jgi:hypothetical protein
VTTQYHTKLESKHLIERELDDRLAELEARWDQAANRLAEFEAHRDQVANRQIDPTLLEVVGRWVVPVFDRVAEGLKGFTRAGRAQRAAIEASRRKRCDELLYEAYAARDYFLKGQRHQERPRPLEPLARFLRTQLRWRTKLTPDHATALWEILQASHEGLVSEMAASGAPEGWLASQIVYRVRRIRSERDKLDTFRGKVLTPDQEQKLRGAGHRQHPDEAIDPAIIVARSNGFERQAIEMTLETGRPASRERAAIVHKCLALELDDKECRRLLGDDAWRSVKRTLVGERERLRKNFSESVRFCPRIDVPR